MFRSFFSYSAAEGLSKALNWLTIALLPLILEPKEYGIVGLIVAIEGILSTITLIGQEKAIFRFHNNGTFKVLNYSFKLVTLFLIAVLFLLFVGRIFSDTVVGLDIFPEVLVLVVSVLFYNQARLLMSYSRVVEDARLFWRTRVLYQVLKIFGVFGCALMFKTGESYIYGCFLSGLIFCLIYFKLIMSNYKPLSSIVVFDKNAIILLGFGAPLIFHAMSGNILSYADRFFVNGFLDSKELGVYTFVYSVGSSIFFFYGTVASYFEPLTYRHHSNKENYQHILKLYLVFVTGFAAIMAFAIKVSFGFVVIRFLNIGYLQGEKCLGLILAAHLIIPFYTIANYELAVLNKTKFIAISTLISATVNILLNYVTIPKLGIAGAAISTYCTYIFLAIVTSIYSRVKAGLDRNYLIFIGTTFLFVNVLVLAIGFLEGRFILQLLTFFSTVLLFLYTLFPLVKKMGVIVKHVK